jgi:hypothetical protein
LRDTRIPNALCIERADGYVTATVHGWTPELETEIAALAGATVEVEGLTLEDIFLAMHR